MSNSIITACPQCDSFHDNQDHRPFCDEDCMNRYFTEFCYGEVDEEDRLQRTDSPDRYAICPMCECEHTTRHDHDGCPACVQDRLDNEYEEQMRAEATLIAEGWYPLDTFGAECQFE